MAAESFSVQRQLTVDLYRVPRVEKCAAVKTDGANKKKMSRNDRRLCVSRIAKYNR